MLACGVLLVQQFACRLHELPAAMQETLCGFWMLRSSNGLQPWVSMLPASAAPWVGR
jgi:hypothetical protein